MLKGPASPQAAAGPAAERSARADSGRHVHRSVQAIKAKGAKAGLTFNPAQPLDVLDWVIDDIDLILILRAVAEKNAEGLHAW